MKTSLKRVVKVLVLGVVTLGVVFIVGMRNKNPTVLRAVRNFNRAVFNPEQMRTAGTPGSYASIIRHVGRTSGAEYQTPVGVVPTDDGFVIALPYGDQADWLQNVLAAGTATIVHEGETYVVEGPEVVPIEEAAEHFSEQDRTAHAIFNVEQALRVRGAVPLVAE